MSGTGNLTEGKKAAIKSSDPKWLLQSKAGVSQVSVRDVVQNIYDTFMF